MEGSIDAYLNGEKLYGEDFTPEQLAKWYEEEAEGYAGLVQQSDRTFEYVYHAVNNLHGFRHAELPMDCVALGVGSAHCDELLPISKHLKEIVSLDPSEYFTTDHLGCVPVRQVRPTAEGKMPFANGHFDVITCFGVLHHVANVTFVLGECYRVLRPGGVMFLREPIVSMGDWRKPRRGATKNERGIPYDLVIGMVERYGFEIAKLTLHDFTPLVRILGKLGVPIFAHRWSSVLDCLVSQVFAYNRKYHRVSTLDRFGPASVFMVLRKK